MTNGQKEALQKLGHRYFLSLTPSSNDWQQLFDTNPVVLEIGFGNGEASIDFAKNHPETILLANDVHLPGVGRLLRRLDEEGLTNVRIFHGDCLALFNFVPESTLAGVHIFFPDPWPKKRHHKRRLIQADFIALLARRLKPGSYVAIATDWADYAMAIEEAFSKSSLFELKRKSRFPRPLTAFEKKALDQGRLVYDFYFTLL
jgi:tRNA (guanine-N7-)-methyltransferase